MPMTEDEMLAINGVGHRKLERFGEAFMDLIIDRLLPTVGSIWQPNRPQKAEACLTMWQGEAPVSRAQSGHFRLA